MNENMEVYSLIERSLLYKMHYFVSAPTLISIGAKVKDILYHYIIFEQVLMNTMIS
jgi:hypothetical protein